MLEPEVLVFMVPITGILSIAAVKIIRIVTGNELPMSKKDLKKFVEEAKRMQAYNAELEERVQNLESIVTSMDTELIEGLLQIKALETPEVSQQKVERMAQAARPRTTKGGANQVHVNAPLEENVKTVLNKLLVKVDGLLEQKKKVNKPFGWN
jgi:cell division septum initiation protein DivIVA